MEYQIGGTVKTRTLEEELLKDIQELRKEVDEHGLSRSAPQRPFSTLSIPEDIDYFRNERAMMIKKSLEVSECHSLLVQAEQMVKESRVERTFTPENLPLLIQQFFIDRIRSLSLCKHLHMARWRRFAVNTEAVEQLYPFYQRRIQLITQEYNDTVARCKRLGAVRNYAIDLYLSRRNGGLPGATSCVSSDTNDNAIWREVSSNTNESQTFASFASYQQALSAVSLEDLFIYLRWYTTSTHLLKRITQFYHLLEYYPLTKQNRVTAEIPKSYADASADDPNSPPAPDAQSTRAARDSMLNQFTAASKAATLATGDLHSVSDRVANVNVNPLEQFSQTCSNQQSIPVQNMNFSSFRQHIAALCVAYKVEFEVQSVVTPGDEMELYGVVCRHFSELFAQQAEAMQFAVADERGGANGKTKHFGMDTWRHAIKSECNWLPFVALRGQSDCDQLAMLTKLRTDNHHDEVLVAVSNFTKIIDVDRALSAMKAHASRISFVESSPTGVQRDVVAVWKEIYNNPALALGKTDTEKEELARRSTVSEKDLNVEVNMESRLMQSRHAIGDVSDDNGGSRATSARSSRAGSARQSQSQGQNRKASNPAPAFGLEDAENNESNETQLSGGFLSYLMLRYLRIRDLRRVALGTLNYFRSIERSITIHDNGLSLLGGKQKRKTLQSHRVLPGGAGLVAVSSELSTGGLACNQAYLFNSLKDYAIAECDYIDFQEFENQDDAWCFEDGRMHVRDAKGYYVMYDAAINDLSTLEADLLLIASHFVSNKRVKRTLETPRDARKSKRNADPAASCLEVDRFGVLYDIWSLETEWLEAKMNLVDCYFEAYQHSFDRDERRRLAQVITDLMQRRARVDYKASYFAKAYRLEILNLRLHTQLVRSIMDQHIGENRDYAAAIFDSKTCFEKPHGNENINATMEGGFGLPYKAVKQYLISLNSSKPLPKSVYMLEFHPTLGAVSRLPEALKYAFVELCHHHRPSTVTATIMLEKRMLEEALSDWQKLPALGSTMSPTTQKDVFAETFAENPTVVNEILVEVLRDHEQKTTKTAGENATVEQSGVISVVCRLLEVLSLRRRLIQSSWQTEVLSDCYRKLCIEAGHEECHLFMRFVQFEFAKHRDYSRGQSSSFVTGSVDEEGVDRYVPNFLSLAIHELDESQVGRVSFKNKDTFLNVLLSASGLDNLQTIIRSQLVHKNAIHSSILLHLNARFLAKLRREKAGNHGPLPSGVNGNDSGKSGSQGKPANSSMPMQMQVRPSQAQVQVQVQTQLQMATVAQAETFVSVQLEKTPLRNLMMNEFIAKKEKMGSLLKNPEELERLKRSLIDDFCVKSAQHFAQFSLRAQLIAYYTQIVSMIDRFPGIRGHFQFSDADRRSPLEDPDAAYPTESRSQRRPKRVLSQNGKSFVNLWYIPSWAELVQLHRNLPISEGLEALQLMCYIAGCLHDMLAYLVAFAQLGNLHNQSIGGVTTRPGVDMEITAEWGGAEGIEAVLREVQKQIESLPKPDSPQLVADFLLLRRNTLFLEFESCLRHSVSELLLASGNDQAFLSLCATMAVGLHNLSNSECASVYNRLLELPAPFAPHDAVAQVLFPDRAFVGQNGPFPLSYWSFKEIERNVKLCVAGLRNMERRIANGELLGLRLLLEDTLQNAANCNFVFGSDDKDKDGETEPPSADAQTVSIDNGSVEEEGEREKDGDRQEGETSKWIALPTLDLQAYAHLASPHFAGALNFVSQPIDSLRLIRWYLVIWQRLEVFKQEWGKNRMMVERIDNVGDYKEYLKLYRAKIFQPVLGSLALKYGQPDLYEGILAEEDILPLPKRCTDFEVKSKELLRLIEDYECLMLLDVKKRVSREINSVLAERARDEATMPTDLWKKPTIKEAHTFGRSAVLENFLGRFHAHSYMRSIGGGGENDSGSEDGNKAVCISDKDLRNCLTKLNADLLHRERENLENYAGFYENLLAQQQSILKTRETEGRVLCEQIRLLKQANTVDVHLDLADRNFSLLLEVTALRSKIAEMRGNSLRQEREIRERVKNDYTKLVLDLFALAFDNRTQFDDFREDTFKDVFELVSEAKTNAIEQGGAFKEKFNSLDQELAKLQARKGEEIRKCQAELNDAKKSMMKTKTFQCWKQAFMKEDFKKQLSELQRRCDRFKIDYTDIKLLALDEAQMLRQQQTELRKLLSSLEVQCTEMQTQLDSQLKEKRERQYSEDQQAVTRRQLKKIKQTNMNKLIYEKDEKESKIHELQVELEDGEQRELGVNALEQSISDMTRRLHQEQLLKTEAVRHAGRLQNHLEEYSDSGYSLSRVSTAKTRARSAISGTWSIGKSERSKSAISSSVSFAPARSVQKTLTVTPMSVADTMEVTGDVSPNANGTSMTTVQSPQAKLRRPRTVSGKLRFADQPELQHSLMDVDDV